MKIQLSFLNTVLIISLNLIDKRIGVTKTGVDNLQNMNYTYIDKWNKRLSCKREIKLKISHENKRI